MVVTSVSHLRTRAANGDGYYALWRANDEAAAAELLHGIFPEGEADDMNLVLFSTSGVHGSYVTIEDVEASWAKAGDERMDSVTFLLVQPRIVSITYGNVRCNTPEDAAFLKRLRASSWRALATIGAEIIP